MSLGIAIPCTRAHKDYLPDLFGALQNSTILPDEVAVSISDFEGELNFDYPFPISVICHKEKLNAAQNRNCAASCLTTDFVSFMDADDLPHKRRNEFVLGALNQRGVVCHGYTRAAADLELDILSAPFIPDCFSVLIKAARMMPPFCFDGKDRAAHWAHVSLRREIWDSLRFREGRAFHRIEDSVFAHDLVKSGFPISYLNAPLSFYRK